MSSRIDNYNIIFQINPAVYTLLCIQIEKCVTNFLKYFYAGCSDTYAK